MSYAQAIVADCQSGKLSSVYSHENREGFSHLELNCYGFMRYLLQKVCPKSYETLVNFMYANTEKIPCSVDGIPCPFHYAAFFSSLQGIEDSYWSSFSDVTELQPGDVIAYFPPGYTLKASVQLATIIRPATHVMIVEKVLSAQEDRVEVVIIDSSRFSHCVEDSRVAGGIGRAPLIIHRRSEGMSIQWGSRDKLWNKDLFFGRLK